MFFLRTFGGLELRRSADGAPIGGPRRKPLAVLALLAAAGDDGMSREHVVTLLWSDDTDERGRRALAQSLYALRRETGQPAIVVGDGTLRLDPAVVRSDLDVFHAARRAGHHAAAAAAYDGPFLDGVFFKGCVEFEQWVDVERARLARAFVDSAAHVATDSESCRDQVSAVVAWRRAFDADPLDSRIAARLAGVLDATGDRTAALRAIHIHEQLLGEQAGALPDAGFRALAARLRAGAGAEPEVHVEGREPTPVALPTGASVVPRGRRRAWAIGTMLLAGASVAVLAMNSRPVDDAVAADRPSSGTRWVEADGGSATVVVLPFVATGDSSDSALGEGAARLLATAIDDAAGVRSTAVGSAIRQLVGTDLADVRSGRAGPERLGAAFYVEGTLVRAGSRLRLTATVRATARPEVAQAEARAEIAPADLFAGVDSLAVQLLTARAATRPGRLVASASRTTSSLSAFKAFLDGERAFREGHYGDALAAYRRATIEDSTFALAYYRRAMAADWAADGGDLEHDLRRARALGDRLPERERLLVVAQSEWLWGSAPLADQTLRRTLELYPDDPEAAYQLGELIVHSGYTVGRPVDDARVLFARVATAEPANVEAIAHLARSEIRAGHVDVADSLARRVRSLRAVGDRLAAELALTVAMARGDRVRLIQVMDSLSQRAGDESLLYIAAWRSVAFTDSAQLAAPFARQLAEHSARAELRTAARLRLAEYAALAGDGAQAIERASDPTQPGWWMLGARAYYAALPSVAPVAGRVAGLTDSLRRWTDVAVTPGMPIDVASTQGATATLREWPLSLLALRMGDTLTAVRSAATLDRIRTPALAQLGHCLATSIRARVAWIRGDRNEAVRLIGDALARAPVHQRLNLFAGFALDRWQRAEWLRALGRHREAVRWYGTLGEDAAGELPFARLAALGAAASYEALGDHASAARDRRRAAVLATNARAELR